MTDKTSKVAIASRGIGAAVAERLATDGYILLCRRASGCLYAEDVG